MSLWSWRATESGGSVNLCGRLRHKENGRGSTHRFEYPAKLGLAGMGVAIYPVLDHLDGYAHFLGKCCKAEAGFVDCPREYGAGDRNVRLPRHFCIPPLMGSPTYTHYTVVVCRMSVTNVG